MIPAMLSINENFSTLASRELEEELLRLNNIIVDMNSKMVVVDTRRAQLLEILIKVKFEDLQDPEIIIDWEHNKPFASLNSEQLRQLHDIYFPLIELKVNKLQEHIQKTIQAYQDATKWLSIESYDAHKDVLKKVNYVQKTLSELKEKHLLSVGLRGTAFLEFEKEGMKLKDNFDNELFVFCRRITKALKVDLEPKKIISEDYKMSYDTRESFYYLLKKHNYRDADLLLKHRSTSIANSISNSSDAYLEKIKLINQALKKEINPEKSFLAAGIEKISSFATYAGGFVPEVISTYAIYIKLGLIILISSILAVYLNVSVAGIFAGSSIFAVISLPYVIRFFAAIQRSFGSHEKYNCLELHALHLFEVTSTYVNNRLSGNIQDLSFFDIKSLVKDISWIKSEITNTINLLNKNKKSMIADFDLSKELSNQIIDIDRSINKYANDLVSSIKRFAMEYPGAITREQINSFIDFISLSNSISLNKIDLTKEFDFSDEFVKNLLTDAFLTGNNNESEIYLGGFNIQSDKINEFITIFNTVQNEGPKKDALIAICNFLLNKKDLSTEGLNRIISIVFNGKSKEELIEALSRYKWNSFSSNADKSYGFDIISEKYQNKLRGLILKNDGEIVAANDFFRTRLGKEKFKCIDEATINHYHALLELAEAAHAIGIETSLLGLKDDINIYFDNYDGSWDCGSAESLATFELLSKEKKDEAEKSWVTKRISWLMKNLETDHIKKKSDITLPSKLMRRSNTVGEEFIKLLQDNSTEKYKLTTNLTTLVDLAEHEGLITKKQLGSYKLFIANKMSSIPITSKYLEPVKKESSSDGFFPFLKSRRNKTEDKVDDKKETKVVSKLK